MTDKEIIAWCKEQVSNNKYITFPDDVFNSLSENDAKAIVKEFGNYSLMKLPAREIIFFEWLKENDRKVWDDLWANDDEKYIVAINYLPLLLNKIRGFPICDLIEVDNYYFTDAHMVDEESKIMIESVKKRYMLKEKLTAGQALVLEASIHPIDIWHFAYRYNLSIEKAKNAVKVLVDDRVLVHLKEAEHLTSFIKL